jgi:hypothetical protein
MKFPEASRFGGDKLRVVYAVMRLRALGVHFVVGDMFGGNQAGKRSQKPRGESVKWQGIRNRIAIPEKFKQRPLVGLP